MAARCSLYRHFDADGTLQEIIRTGLESVFDTRMVDQPRPELALNTAMPIGEARLRGGMSMTPLAALAWASLIAAEVADATSFAEPLPGFDLDAELDQIRQMVQVRLEEPAR